MLLLMSGGGQILRACTAVSPSVLTAWLCRSR